MAEAGGIVANTESFVKEHPAGVAVGVVLALVLIWLLTRGSSSSGSTAAPNAGAADAYAAQLGAAQISANATTAQAQIAAGVANQATSAQEQTAITSSNNQTAVALSQSDAVAAASGNATLGSEFASLADVLKTYSSNETAQQMNNADLSASLTQSVATDATSYAESSQGNTLATQVAAGNFFSKIFNNWNNFSWLGTTTQNLFGGGATGAGGAGGGSTSSSTQSTAGQASSTASGILQSIAAGNVINVGQPVNDQSAAAIQSLISKVGDGVTFHAE